MKITFFEKRMQLFFSSYVAEALGEMVRKRHGLSKPVAYSRWQATLRKTYPNELATFEAARKLRNSHVDARFQPDTSIQELELFAAPEVSLLSTELDIPTEELLYYFISTRRRPKDKFQIVSNRDPNSVFWAQKAASVFPPGTYIRVHSRMKSRELSVAYKTAMPVARAMVSDDEDETRDERSTRRRELCYLGIEKWLKLTKEDKFSDYGSGHFIAALDGYVDELIDEKYPTKVDDDVFVDKLKRKLKDDYYSVISTYSLPSISSLKSLQKVMSQ